MKLVGVIAATLALFGAAQAAPITVANGDFEDASPLTKSYNGIGSWGYSAAGWTISGGAGGVIAPDFGGIFSSAPSALEAPVGWINSRATMSQDLGVAIAADTDYTLSALIGDRLDYGLSGVFGFYAGSVSNVIASASLVSSNGVWTLNEITMLASTLASYVGQSLGIFFYAGSGQVDIDVVTVNADSLFDDAQVVVNPLPAAVWLFGTALLGGGFLARRKKAA